MRKRNKHWGIMVAIIGSTFFSQIQPVQAAESWQTVDGQLMEPNILTLTQAPAERGILYIGTQRAVYRVDAQGRKVEALLNLTTRDQQINDVYVSAEHPVTLYAATNDGVYISEDAGNVWSKTFAVSDRLVQRVQSIREMSGTVYTGTLKGLYYKEDKKGNWIRMTGPLAKDPVFHLEQDKQFIYAVTQNRIYRINSRHDAQEIFSEFAASVEINDEFFDEDGEAVVPAQGIRDLQVVRDEQGLLKVMFAASKRGIFYRTSNDESWQTLPVQAYLLSNLNALVVEETLPDDCSVVIKGTCCKMAIGTDDGVYQLKEGRWHSLYKGMPTNQINDLAFSPDGALYSATDKGLYFLNGTKALSMEDAGLASIDYDKTKQKLRYEPSVKEIHSLAIDYAEVHPNKIKEWRKLSKKKAWLPSLSVGVDGDRDLSYSDSLSVSSSGSFALAPDDKTFGQDFGWDVSLSWDLADLIWSTDQTTIDSRSKLMVELREDILDQVTRLYFERRRLQIELVSQSAHDPAQKMDKEMRIEELTALIDGYTGGEFSRLIEERKKDKSPGHKVTTSPKKTKGHQVTESPKKTKGHKVTTSPEGKYNE